MGQEQSSEAGPSAEEQAATKIQAIKRGQAARRRNPCVSVFEQQDCSLVCHSEPFAEDCAPAFTHDPTAFLSQA